MKRILIKDLKSELKMVMEEREEWRRKYYDKEKECLTLRRWIQGKFDWWLELINTSPTSSPCLKYLIKNTAMILGMKEQ